MKKTEIKVGGLYAARISGRYVTVRVDAIREGVMGPYRDRTVYDVTNLYTGRKTIFHSAAKFRSEVQSKDAVKATFDSRTQEAIEMSEPAAQEASKEGNPTDSVPAVQSGATGIMEGEQRSDPTIETQMEDTQLDTQSAVITQSATAVTSVPNVEQSTVLSRDAGATATHSRLAAKIAACAVPTTVKLTQEQEDILTVAREIEAARGNGQRVMVIGAGAGTGKTFTLKQLEQVLAGRGQYTAFNKSLVEESKAKFTRASCKTTHSLAFGEVGRRFAHRLNGARVKSYQIASILGIEDYYVELPESVQPKGEDGKPATRRLKAAFLAGQIVAAIRKFCQSADPEISLRSLPHFDGIDAPETSESHGMGFNAGRRSTANSDKVRAYLLPFATKAWADLSSETGTLPFSHDVYVKIWQLGEGQDRPVIAADYILLDEAQDTAPVMLDVLKRQTHALLILVGDDNQQIYEWRGAVNAMAAFAGAPRRLLSQSFRFGQAVADVANSVLAGLDEPTDLVMRGLESIPTRVCEVNDPMCYLFRTNAGAVGKLMQAHAAGKRGHLIGGTKDVVDFCQAAEDLQRNVGTTHSELGCFFDWAEVQVYSKEAEGADLRLMVKLIDEFGAAEIRHALKDMPKEEDADLILSTTHRSKGREWKSVRLGPDFPTANKLGDADRRLLYVACTRAQEELDVTQCPTFCGGYDRKGGGEDGNSSAEWIPGIYITYTVPMPTAEALAAYRAAKSAKKSPTIADRPAQATATTASVAAPTSTPAPANGGCNGSVASGEFSWAIMNGGWCVRGPKERKLGERVTVTRKDSTKSEVALGVVTRKLGDLWFYVVK